MAHTPVVAGALMLLSLAAATHRPTPDVLSQSSITSSFATRRATFNWKLGRPTPLAITADGAVLFRRNPARAFASDLYELAPDGKVRTARDRGRSARHRREHLPTPRKLADERTRTATRAWSTSTSPRRQPS